MSHMEQAYGFTPKRIQYHTLESALRSYVDNNYNVKVSINTDYFLLNRDPFLCIHNYFPYITHTQDKDKHNAMLPILEAITRM